MSGWVYGPGGGSTSPGGSNGDIQFNSSGSFSGSALLTTDGAGSLSASANISASAFYGDGSNLTNVTASAVEVADGPQYSLQFRFDSPVSGDLSGSSDLLWDPATSDVLISGNVRRIFLISGRKPMSSMRSPSSSTKISMRSNGTGFPLYSLYRLWTLRTMRSWSSQPAKLSRAMSRAASSTPSRSAKVRENLIKATESR